MYVNFKKIKDIIKLDWSSGESQPANPDNHKTHMIMSEIREAYNEHIKKLPIFTVLYRRYGDEEGHTYLGGNYLSLEEAIANTEEEYDYRGGKYYGEIYKTTVEGDQEKVFDLAELHKYRRELISKNGW